MKRLCMFAFAALLLAIFAACGSPTTPRESLRSVTGTTIAQADSISRVLDNFNIDVRTIRRVYVEPWDDVEAAFLAAFESYDIVAASGNEYHLTLNAGDKSVFMLVDGYGNILYGELSALFDGLFDGVD